MMKKVMLLLAVIAVGLIIFSPIAEARGPQFNAGFNAGFNKGVHAEANFQFNNGFHNDFHRSFETFSIFPQTVYVPQPVAIPLPPPPQMYNQQYYADVPTTTTYYQTIPQPVFIPERFQQVFFLESRFAPHNFHGGHQGFEGSHGFH